VVRFAERVSAALYRLAHLTFYERPVVQALRPSAVRRSVQGGVVRRVVPGTDAARFHALTNGSATEHRRRRVERLTE